jgi:hypothetical protein
VVPQVFGCVDKSYPGSADFPPVPFILPWLNAYWFTRKHRGAWRFNPCDEWGRPRPLQFLSMISEIWWFIFLFMYDPISRFDTFTQ